MTYTIFFVCSIAISISVSATTPVSFTVA